MCSARLPEVAKLDGPAVALGQALQASVEHEQARVERIARHPWRRIGRDVERLVQRGAPRRRQPEGALLGIEVLPEDEAFERVGAARGVQVQHHGGEGVGDNVLDEVVAVPEQSSARPSAIASGQGIPGRLVIRVRPQAGADCRPFHAPPHASR
jgi:hypothetical protein